MHHVLRTWAGNHTLYLNTYHAPTKVLCGDGLRNQTIDFLGWTARDRCPPLEWIGSTDIHVSPESFLLLYNSVSDMFGKQLNFRPGIGINTLHYLLQSITEARHMHARLCRIKVGVEVKGRVKPVLAFRVANQNCFVETNDTCTPKANMHIWFAILNVSIERDT